ncbi:MAG: hypothetical protein M1833_002325 [Piccolia ochrophora]|nr:MAG: hypothetical protein M1833_002325 [Piccolia ochrophora]
MDLKNTPLYPTPPGQVSNLDNPVTLSQAIIVTSSICLGLMIPIASLRLYHRTFVTRAFWWDDGACILAIFGAVGFTATTLSSLNYTGLHQLDIPASEFTEAIAQKHTLVYQMTFGPTMFFTKLSLFLLYLRLFSPSVRIKYLVHLGIALCFIVYGGTTIAQGIFCIPKRGETWRDGMKRQQCQDGRFIGYVVGSFNVVSDFYILILPLPAIWKLNMATRQKIGLCGVFMMGFLACVSTILGLYIRVLMNLKTDIAWYLGWLCMFIQDHRSQRRDHLRLHTTPGVVLPTLSDTIAVALVFVPKESAVQDLQRINMERRSVCPAETFK